MVFFCSLSIGLYLLDFEETLILLNLLRISLDQCMMLRIKVIWD